MRHNDYKYKLGVSPEHRRSMLRNLASDLIEHGKIKTTHTRTQALKPFIEKLVTIAKADSVANRRLVYSKLNNRNATNKLFTEVAPKFTERAGGYTRVIKTSDTRLGDASKMSYISFVD